MCPAWSLLLSTTLISIIWHQCGHFSLLTLLEAVSLAIPIFKICLYFQGVFKGTVGYDNSCCCCCCWRRRELESPGKRAREQEREPWGCLSHFFRSSNVHDVLAGLKLGDMACLPSHCIALAIVVNLFAQLFLLFPLAWSCVLPQTCPHKRKQRKENKKEGRNVPKASYLHSWKSWCWYILA